MSSSSCRVIRALSIWLAAGLAPAALALNPSTDDRAGDVAQRTGVTLQCEGGPNDGDPCLFSSDCQDPAGKCTGIANVFVVARGHLTIIADTMLFEDPANPSNPWDEAPPSPLPDPLPCTAPAPGNPSSCETQSRSSITLLLEFPHDGKQYVFAETFLQLPDEFRIAPAQAAGWVQPAVESTLSERVAFIDGVQIRWGFLPPAAEAKVRAAVGGLPTQRVVLSRVDDVPICTDPLPCQHGPRNDRFQDQAGPADVLATVRRYKVDIAIAPGGWGGGGEP
jgi:hypothetical protein